MTKSAKLLFVHGVVTDDPMECLNCDMACSSSNDSGTVQVVIRSTACGRCGKQDTCREAAEK